MFLLCILKAYTHGLPILTIMFLSICNHDFTFWKKKLMYLKPRNPVKVGENYVFIFYPSSAEIWCWWPHLIYIISVYIWYLRFKKCRIIFADDYYLVKHDCWIELSLVHFDWIKLLNFVWLIRKVYNFDWLL